MGMPWYRLIATLLSAVLLTVGGCSERSTPPRFESLIRVNDRSISVAEFNRRYDAASAESPIQSQADPLVEKELKLRLLNQLTEELILLERAEEMNLEVTDEELQAAVDRIRADYPDGEFKKVLLEQAISYDVWKEQLRTRLLEEKVVREDLEASVVLTPAEMTAAYEALYPSDGAEKEGHLIEPDIDAKVVKLVRRQKAQKAYRTWLENLQNRYEVEVNFAAWEKMNDS
ncbi:MAG: SurA N-terminal domain-containing protein [Deltaproteobacteria bacterium]|jgi:hypothetical protein|nr:SurA N-terminal domain-containing protein [Deltaproteobacteria bacterium]